MGDIAHRSAGWCAEVFAGLMTILCCAMIIGGALATTNGVPYSVAIMPVLSVAGCSITRYVLMH